MSAEVIWTGGASAELQQVFEHINGIAPDNAEQLLQDVSAALDLLKLQPYIGSHFVKPSRKWLISGRYGMIYAPEPRGIVVLSFIDMRTDLQPLRKKMRDWFGRAN
ncbi:MAG: type II toxin-antitoxin system RelE/ParE family toxin [Verrucomicrobiales bacterium]|nr:type II toxin-antitoxin system RelE/ParE family toxin [Verrucomicrobiales bacterium]MCP5558123.1 type II toxin-antitoxin system RelE/ParE family toxin [Verrucomicrobiaceae bacterium]